MIWLMIALGLVTQNPPGDELETVFVTGQAAAEGGWARLNCEITPEGSPQDCRVIDESHPDGRFGEAALRVMAEARFAPPMEGGAPTTRRATFTIRFNPAPPSEAPE